MTAEPLEQGEYGMTKNTKKNNAEIFELRKRYVKLRQSGQNNKVASNNVGFSEATGSRVWNQYNQLRDYDALELKKPGRKKGEKTKLSKEQELKIKNLLLKSTPAELNLKNNRKKFNLWTREAIRLAIEKELSINLPVRTITDYLKRWRCVPIKPVKVVKDAKPKKYRSWLKQGYLRLKSRAEEEGYEIHWCDTNEVSAKRGISMISSTNNQGEIRFLLYKGELTGEIFANFLSGLKRDSQPNIWLIMYRKEVFPKEDFTGLKRRARANVKTDYLTDCWTS